MSGIESTSKRYHCYCCGRFHKRLLPLIDWWLCGPCYDFVRTLVDPYYHPDREVSWRE